MLVALTRNNQIASIVLLPLFLAVMWLPAWLRPAPPEMDTAMPLFRWLFSWAKTIPWLATFIAYIFALVQAFLVKNIFDQFGIRDKSNYAPSFIFAIFFAAFNSFTALNPVLLSSLLLMLAFIRLISAYRQEQVFSNVFDAGLLTGLASLFWLPAVLLFLLTWFSLAILRPFIWREWAISLIGAILPWLFISTYFFWVGKLGEFFSSAIEKTIAENYFDYSFEPGYYIFVLILALLAFPAGLNVLRNLTTGNIRKRKYFQLILSLIVLVVLSFLLFPTASSSHFQMLVFPFSLIYAAHIISFKKKWISEVIFLLMALSVLAGKFFTGFSV